MLRRTDHTSTVRKRVLLLVNFKYRDLPGLALLKVLLEARGPYEAVLAPNVAGLGGVPYLRSVKPSLVVFPNFVDQAEIASARLLRDCGIGVAVMPTEGMPIVPERRLVLAGKFVDFANVDLFFIWNRTVAELVRSLGTIPDERCRVAGVPRFDFYHTPLRKLILSRGQFCSKYGLNPRRPTITWATNFGLTRFAGKPSEVAGFIQYVRAKGLADSPLYRDIPALIDGQVESRRVLTEAVLRAAGQFREANVVIKVHPVEEGDWYQEQARSAGLGNVRIVSREYIWDVLNATDVHLHRACTTAIEAWLLDKPTVDLQFVPGEWVFRQEFAPGGDLASSADQLLTQLHYHLAGHGIPEEQRAARTSIIEWFSGAADGQSASRHADAIHAWLEGAEWNPEPPSWTWKELRFAATSRIKSLVGLQPYHSMREWLRGGVQDGRGKYFTPEEAREWVLNIRRVLNESEPTS